MSILSDQTFGAVGRNRASALLGVSPDAEADEQRRAALANLEEADYAPPPAWQDAVEILFEWNGDRENFREAPKAALREEVVCGLLEESEAFAARFFSFEPAERRRMWNDLCERVRISPVLERRMAVLQPGLELTGHQLEASGDDRESRLIRWIARMFPLRPTARGALWTEARDAMRDDPAAWEHAAGELLRDRPEIARLVPELIDEARSLTAQQRQWERQLVTLRRQARRQKRARAWSAAGEHSGYTALAIMVGISVAIRLASSFWPSGNSPQQANSAYWPPGNSPARVKSDPNHPDALARTAMLFALAKEETAAWDRFLRTDDLGALDRDLERIREEFESAGLRAPRDVISGPSETMRALLGRDPYTPEERDSLRKGMEGIRRIRGFEEKSRTSPNAETTLPGESALPALNAVDLKLPESNDTNSAVDPHEPAP